MVLLTMTPSLVEGLQSLDEETRTKLQGISKGSEPELASPAVGSPISLAQILDISKTLKKDGKTDYSLEDLLLGAKVYIPPPPPKPEQSDEYKALMARLRRDEENRAYERMINPTRIDTFEQRYPNAPTVSAVRGFAEVNRPRKEDEGTDDISLKEINRQLTVIFNVIVSIFGVAFTVWWVARWRSTPERLLLTLFSAILTGIADAVVYAGFLRSFVEEKPREKRIKEPEEVKEIVNTWTVSTEEPTDRLEMVPKKREPDERSSARRRNKAPS